MADVALGDVGIHDVLKGRVTPLVDARHLGEAGIEELLAVSNAACNEGNGHMMTLGSLEDAERELAHQRLTVGRALTSNDESGVLQLLVEANGVEQQVNTRTAVGIQILQEGITESASSTSARPVLTVEAEVTG